MFCRPQRPGFELVAVSLELLELVALAHISCDERLLQCLSDADPLCSVASAVLMKVCSQSREMCGRS
jgi:hypothetical protein